MTTYGLTPTGFVMKQQQTIISEIQASLQGAFGQNINLLPRSVFGQLVGIFSERESLLWQALEAIYASAYPTGASGTSVDNILALNNLQRLPAAATKTAATDTSGTPGLLLFGTPGTVVPAGSLIGVNGHETTVQFAIDADETIQNPVDAIQQIRFAGGVPTTGSFTLSIVDPNGQTLTTTALGFGATAANVQAAIRALNDLSLSNFPYTDVVVTGTIGVLFTVSFGAASPTGSNPSSGGQPQSLFTVVANSLMDGTVVVNVQPVTTQIGAPAEVVASATCTATGPNFVAAGQLTSILSPVFGWASVTNPLDCLTGRDLETDLAALTRRAESLTENANGPVQAIAEKVSLLPGVIQARGYQNTSLAANQEIAFDVAPTAGTWKLTLGGFGGFTATTAAIPWNAQASIQTVKFSAPPTVGTFTLTLGALTTSAFTPTSSATQIQATIRALTPGAGYFPYANVTVSGTLTPSGLAIAFGINSQLPITATPSGLDASIAVVASVQSYINAVSGYEPATVTGSYAAGFELAFNGSTGGQGQNLAIAANSLTGTTTITITYGLSGKAFEIVVDDNNGETPNLTIAMVIYASQPGGIESFGTVSNAISDTAGNTYDIRFSRPVQIPIYVRIDLVTDLTSSRNPQFNPASVTTIQDDIAEIGSKFEIGGLIIGFGSGGLIGAFNSVPGILSYQMSFGTSTNPTSNDNIQLQRTQAAEFESFNVIVSYI